MNTRHLLVTALVALIGLMFVVVMWMQNTGEVDLAVITPTETPSTTPALPQNATSTVLLAMLDTDGISNGPSEGCDKVVMVNQVIPPTNTPLTAAMQALFGIGTTSVQGWFNYIARTNATLQFQNATIVGGTANIYLTGSLSGLAGVCDNPRTDIQIKRTALQFPSVQSVQLYLNNQPIVTLAPNMQ